jgi:hypothetical protein
MVSPNAKVVERFTRVSNDELNYQFTVVDPATYAQPWFGEYSMMRSNEPMYEFATTKAIMACPTSSRAGARSSAGRRESQALRPLQLSRD